MFRRIKNFFLRPRARLADENIDLEIIGDDLDNALRTYADLRDSDCRDALTMDAALERIADLRERYQQSKLDHLQDWSNRQ